MVSISDDSLLNEFVAESRDHLNSIEPDLLALEAQGADLEQEVINRIFRAIHSIKGAAGFFGLENLKNLSHIMENILMLIRDGKMVPSSDVVDPLLEGVDKLNIMLDDIGDSESVDCQALLSQLESVVSGQGGTPPKAKGAEGKVPGQLVPDPQAVEYAVSHGQFLYKVKVYLDKDLKDKSRTPIQFMELLDSMGSVLDSTIDVDTFPNLNQCLESSLCFVFLYASVVEGDLVPAAIEVDEEQIEEVQASQYKGATEPAADHPAPEVSQAAAEVSNHDETEGQSQNREVQPVTESSNKSPKAPKSSSGGSSDAIESVRVKVDLLNKLMNLAGEMVLLRNQLIRKVGDSSNEIEGLPSILQNLNLTTTELQENIMQTRMQPIGTVFGKFPRVVRDLSKSLNKEIDLRITGDDVELDKSLLEALSDPLTHLIRNSCDHGLELPDDRKAAGKNTKGLIMLDAFQEGGQINIRIQDDGKGIDGRAVAEKAISKGLISDAEVKQMTDKELLNLIFLPGLSLAKKVSDVSGRGVGMDVVRANISKLGGSISIESDLGEGTTILLSLPLTLAIIPSLVVQTEAHRFAIPQLNLEEIICVQASEVADRIEKIGSSDVLRLRGKLLPLVRLADVLGITRTFEEYSEEEETPKVKADRRGNIADRRRNKGNMDEVQILESIFAASEPVAEKRNDQRRQVAQQDIYIVVLKVGTSQYGLIVDRVLNLEEIVVKPLSTFLKDCQAFSGSTIMGDGRVAMILDVNGIATQANLNFKDIQEHEEKYNQQKTQQDPGSRKTKMDIIMFNNSDNEVFAVPLDTVQRLEKFDTQNIELVGSNEYLSYRGKGLSLVRLEQVLPVSPASMDLNEGYLILPKDGKGLVGILASRIIDTDRVEIELQETMSGYEGVLGSAVIEGHLVTFIDPNHLLRAMGYLNLPEIEEAGSEQPAAVY